MANSGGKARFTRGENKSHGKAFLEYLDVKGLRESGKHSKEFLKNKYNNDFRSIHEKQPRFGDVWYALKTARLIQHIQSDDADKVNFTSGQGSRSRGSPPKASTAKTESSPSTKATTATIKDQNEISPKRSRGRNVARIAVDQHLTVRAAGEDVLQQKDTGLPQGMVKETGSYYYCKMCGKGCCSRSDAERHGNSKRHRAALLMIALKQNRDELMRDKDNICVKSIDADDRGKIKVQLKENVAKETLIEVYNTSDDEALNLTRCEMLKRVRVFSLDDTWKVTEGQTTHCILPGENYTVKLRSMARRIGSYSVLLAFEFERPSTPGKKYQILRYVHASVSNSLIEELMPKEPYKRPPRKAKTTSASNVDEGLPPSRETSALECKMPLEQYYVPSSLRRLMNHGLKQNASLSEEDNKELLKLQKLLDSPLTMETYTERFSKLLHMEEVQMEVDIRKYDMDEATMDYCQDNRRLLTLKVPGVAENRPSVLRGDWLYVRRHLGNNKLDDIEYKGYVHDVRASTVCLGFSENMMKKFVPNMKFSVRFTFSRFPLRLQHRALQLAQEHSCDKLLLPTPSTVCKGGLLQPLDTQLRLYDRKLEDNQEQLLAVQHIVAGTSRPAPYILFGPPGTGKTVTIVEAMKQVLKLYPKACILACASSNSAVDLLTERLLTHVDKKQVLRLHALSRGGISCVPDSIRACSNYNKMEGKFYIPAKKELEQYKVLACTLVTAGRLASASFPSGHFSHVFIDECGQGIESESVISVAGVLDDVLVAPHGGQLVLAGDPQQLGPVLRSPVAIQHGLDVSLLERLMTSAEVYARHPQDEHNKNSPYDRRLITKLLRNYRSHPDILSLPNRMFYDDELQPCADKLMRESLCHWEGLPKKGFPVVFNGVMGQDMQEERSPSFFNPQEVTVVLQYVQDLMSARSHGIRVKEEHIGIISPYRKQVQKIRQVLQKNNLNKIKVGSTEEFQGQERNIIIISTVRSNPDFMVMDLQYKLGFLKNPKRFNVAVTRAKALLVVVGNPNILSQDVHWNGLLTHCQAHGAYTGDDFEPDEDISMEDLIQRFAAVSLTNLPDSKGAVTPGAEAVAESMGSLDITEKEHQEEPEWRGDM